MYVSFILFYMGCQPLSLLDDRCASMCTHFPFSFHSFMLLHTLHSVITDYGKHRNQRKKLKTRKQYLRGKPKAEKITGESQNISLYQFDMKNTTSEEKSHTPKPEYTKLILSEGG